MTPLQEITKLKTALTLIESNRGRKEGALTERRLDLKSVCGTVDVAEAKAMLTKLRDECDKVEEQLSEALDKFKEDYADLF